MDLNINNITFIIVCHKSERVIYDCLNSLPSKSKKIIIENSNNHNLKKDLESKYDNIEVKIIKNIGMGASNNIGINISKTDFVYVINPDVILKTNTFENLVTACKNIDDFALLTPIHSEKRYPNYKSNSLINSDTNIFPVDSIDGFSMLINKKLFTNNNFFDENIFLYLENDDLCLRAKKSGHGIFVIKNSEIIHTSKSSFKENYNMEYLRNWHWMWSKFYFNKKHFGLVNAYIKTIPNLISAILKFILYSLLFNSHKKKIYKMRILGLFNSMLGNRSYFRVY